MFQRTARLISFTATLLISFLNLHSQSVDELLRSLKSANHDTTRCGILSDIADQLPANELELFNADLKRICRINLNRISAADPHYRKFKSYEAIAINNDGFVAASEGDPELAIQLYKQSLRIRKELREHTGIATSYVNIAAAHEQGGLIATAMAYYDSSLYHYKKANYKPGEAISLNNIGRLQSDLGDKVSALKYYDSSLKLLQLTSDKNLMSYVLNNMAQIYYGQNEKEKALQLLKQSLNLRLASDDKTAIAASYNNLGYIYDKQGDTANALKCYLNSWSLRKEINDLSGLAEVLGNIGLLYQSKGDNQAALSNLLEALRYSKLSGSQYHIASANAGVGYFYLQQKNYRKAISYNNWALEIARLAGYPEIMMDATENLSNAYRNQKHFQAALEHYETHIHLRDSIHNIETRSATIKHQAEYEYREKKAIDAIKHEADMQRQRDEAATVRGRQIMISTSIALILIVVSIYSFVLRKRMLIIKKQKKQIELKEAETSLQKILIQQKHEEITESMSYASRIQRSFLAETNTLKKNLKDYFVIYKPKDIVSGDFYWTATLRNRNFAVVTGDSTGHGVPGAIMSLLNIHALEKGAEEHIDPADILNTAREIIINRLQTDGSAEGGKDGMDCSLMVFDFKTLELQTACANSAVWIIREGALTEISGDKMPVGKGSSDFVPFKTHHFQLQKNDLIYTFTDGYADQFGGPKGKKFMSKRLKELLLRILPLSTEDQKQQLDEALAEWKGTLEQVDDITLLGIRI